jgi:hypothetical protein
MEDFPLSLATVAVALATMLVSVASGGDIGPTGAAPGPTKIYCRWCSTSSSRREPRTSSWPGIGSSSILPRSALPTWESMACLRTPERWSAPSVSSTTTLGVFVAFKIVEEDVVLAFFGPGMDRHWQILEPYVQQERELRKSSWPESSFLVFFEGLVARYRKRPSLEIYGDRRLLKVTGD